MEEIIPTSANAQAVNAVSPPAQAATTTTTTPEPQAGDGNSEQLSLEEAKKLRKEAQALRARLKTYDDAETAKQQAALSDVEKANKRAADLEQKYQTTQKQLVNAHVRIAAQSKNIIDPELATLAIADKLEYDENGMPSNVDKLLDELIKNKPFFVKPAEPATQNQQRQTPQFTANNPGRQNIQQPGPKRVRLSDLL